MLQDCLLVFFVQFMYVFLLGFQSRNVFHQDYLRSACTSLLLGGFGLYLTSMIAISAVREGNFWVQVSYVVSGPPAILFAIWFEKRSRKDVRACGQCSTTEQSGDTGGDTNETPGSGAGVGKDGSGTA